MNASGVRCERIEDLKALDRSKAGSFVTKTATLEARPGNEMPRIYSFAGGSINSSGLPNQGIDYYLQAMESFNKENPDKNYFLSLTELSKENIIRIMEKVNNSSYRGLVELNLSCPNLVGKAQVGYDFDLVDEILDRIFDFFEKPLGVKLPPYFDMAHFDQVAKILNKYPLSFINTINSIGNAIVIEDESVTIKPKNGYGGLGGPLVKQTALANVHAFYTRLNPSIAIIGTGGVTCGRDVFEHILCGASMVQIGSQLLVEEEEIFERLTRELGEIMDEKGYKSLEDFRGGLNYI